jgi:transposase, IS30 family
MSEFKHLCLYDRQRIERYLRVGKSLHFIAGKLGRSVSSISDEIRLNNTRGVYNTKKAQAKADLRRKNSKLQCMKVAMDPDLKNFVIKNIIEDQSPEGISGRLREVERDVQYASTKAIYKFVQSTHGRQIEKHLYSKAVHKKGGPKRGTSVSIDSRTMIDERPQKVDKRLEFGHFEGDFIESGKDGKGSLLVLVERKTRYPFIQYLEDRSTKNVNRLVREMLEDIPILSLTLDNDLSFQKHKELSEIIEAEIFFCHAFASHEKGTVENRNKSVRRYLKKKTDLSNVPKETILFVQEKLRNKYMKCLDFKTPKEAFKAELDKIEMKKSARSGMMRSNVLLKA